VIEDNMRKRGVVVSLFVFTVGLKGGTLYNIVKSHLAYSILPFRKQVEATEKTF
jgi:hypothetical protein